MDTKLAVEVFLNSRRAKGLSKRTIQWYQNILEKFALMFPDLPQSPESIEAFLSTCKAGDERLHGYFRTLRALYRFTSRRFQISNVLNLVETPKRRRKTPKPITLDQLNQLLSFPHSLRTMAILNFLAESGARIGELANIKPEDIIVSEWGPLVRVNGKTGERVIPISVTTCRDLYKIIPFNVKVDQLTRLVSQAFRDAHVRGSAHRLRHTFGTYWDGDDLELKDIMGHSNLATTARYHGLRLKKICEQHHRYNPLRLVNNNRQLNLLLK